MTRVSRWAVSHPVWGLVLWVGIMVLVGILGTRFGGSYNDNFELPDTESTKAQELLQDLPGGGGSFDSATGKIIWKSDGAAVTDPATAATVTAMPTEISTMPGVDCVQTPYAPTAPLGANCPAAQGTGGEEGQDPTAGLPQTPEAKRALASLGAVGVSPDQPIAYGTVLFHGQADEVPTDQVSAVAKIIEAQASLTGDFFNLWSASLKRAGGEEVAPVAEPDKRDSRFRDPDWTDHPTFDFIKQAYLIGSRWAETMVDKATRQLAIKRDDELVKATMLTDAGKIVHPAFAEAQEPSQNLSPVGPKGNA